MGLDAKKEPDEKATELLAPSEEKTVAVKTTSRRTLF